DVAVIGSYAYQTGIPLLPRDFSFIGVMATYNIFDFGKRERSMQERKTQLAMAEGALEATKAKVASEVQKSFLDLQRSQRIRDLTRRLAATYQVVPASYQKGDWEAAAARAKAEEEMFQAEFEYRLAVVQLKNAIGR
ncbi:MAG: TolC family protein, partial [Blastocatellia bacterium]|nr:TolC family protein [Blastocatellia bacterium]